jgi:hypothetical protein
VFEPGQIGEIPRFCAETCQFGLSDAACTPIELPIKKRSGLNNQDEQGRAQAATLCVYCLSCIAFACFLNPKPKTGGGNRTASNMNVKDAELNVR